MEIVNRLLYDKELLPEKRSKKQAVTLINGLTFYKSALKYYSITNRGMVQW